MSQQLKTAKELVEKLLVTSKRFSIPPELLSIIDLLAKTLAPESLTPQSSSTPSATPYPPTTDFDALLLQFLTASDELKNPEITAITETALTIFEMMKMILAFSFNAKKPQQSQVQGIAQIVSNKSLSIAKLAPNHPLHVKPITEGLSAVFWVFSDLPKQTIDAAIEPSEFAALKLQQQKIPQLSKWINLYIQALKSLNTYVKANYPTGLSWNFKGEGDFPTLYSQLRGEIPSTLHGTSAPQPESFTAPAVQVAPSATVVSAPVTFQPSAAQSVASYPPITELDKAISQFQAAAEKLEPELQELTTLVLNAFDWMKTIIQFSKELSKPNADQLKQIQKILQDVIFKPINSSKAGVKFPNHLKTAIQGLSSVIWVLSDMPKTSIDNGIESSEFYGNKILLMKQPDHSAWNNAFKAMLKSLLPYVLSNYSTGLVWKYKGSEDYAELYSALSEQRKHGAVAPPPPVSIAPPTASVGLPPPPPPPPMINLPTVSLADLGVTGTAPAEGQSGNSALLAALNVGDAITANLKHVVKGEKYQKSVVAPAKTTAVAKDVAVKEVAKKEPKKYKKDNMFLENFVGERIEIEADEILQKESLFIDNCNNCQIVIKGKVKSVFINKCKKSNVLVTNAVSGVEVVDCNSSQIYIMEKVPSIQVDKSDTVRITFMKDKECDIVSSKTSGLNITYALNDEGDMEKDTPIPEQFITKWDPSSKTFKTKLLDTFLC